MKLKFNIIFTPGTVKYLRLFTLNLLEWSDCSFRLVSNGCPEKERDILEYFCHKRPRLEFLALPFNGIIKHGKALSYLQMLEKSEYFCFMDSDIFATSSFMDEFIPYIAQYCGVFSGTAIWLREQEQIMSKPYSRVGGRFNWTSDGLCLGSSFFAIYNNHILTHLLNETALTFDKYHGWDIVPTDIRDDIARLGMRKKRYDTAKLVNILLISRGNRLFFRDSEKLCHLII